MKSIRLSAASKQIIAGMTAAILALASCTTAYAGVWKHDEQGHFYEAEDGISRRDSWDKIDGKYYYFDKNGYLLSDTFTPLGYHIAKDGHWDQAEIHHYYCDNVPQEELDKADTLCRELAEIIMKDQKLKTDLDRVKAAAGVISSRAAKLEYSNDLTRHCHSPYGMLILGTYNSQGASHTLGRVMEYMGLHWIHSQGDDWDHQKCILMMDGRIGFADARTGVCGYGDLKKLREAGIVD